MIGSDWLIRSVLSGSPCRGLSFLPPHNVEMEGREDGRRRGGVEYWRNSGYWVGGAKQEMTILGT